MRVAIVGAGAMGSVFGSALASSGVDTFLIDVAEPLVDRVRQDGVTVIRDGLDSVVRINATTEPQEVGVVDVVFFFVKCYHTSSAAEAAAVLAGEETVIVSLQNGWGNGDVLGGHFDPDRLVVGVTYHSGTVLEDGRVAHTGIGPTFVGPYNSRGRLASARVRELLSAANLEVTDTQNVREEIWKKLVLNAATLPTSALTGLTAGALGQPGPMLDLVDRVAEEAIAVGRAAGYSLDSDERLARIHSVLVGAGAGKASMLQDFEAGRASEIDVITGAVVTASEEHGVPAPLNGALLALVTGAERARDLR